MTTIRVLACIALLGAAACHHGASQQPPASFMQSLRMCKQRAWTSCAGLWSCEERVQSRCLAEQGWKQVQGEWRRGKDWERAREIDAQLEGAG